MTGIKNSLRDHMKRAAQGQQRDRDQEIAIAISKKKLLEGTPIFVELDEIVASDHIIGKLLVDTFGVKAGQRVHLKQAAGHNIERTTLQTAIQGNQWVSPLIKGDVIGFESGYVENNKIMTGAVAVRVHDKLLGKAQVITAMTRPTRAVVNKKGALQSGIIVDASKAMAVSSIDGLKIAFERVSSEKWPGGDPGFIIRDSHGGAIDFFSTKERNIDHLIEDLQHEDVAPTPDYLLEVIPAWSLPMGKDQIIKDVNPRVETGKSVIGEFSSKYATNNKLGFVSSFIVVSMEEEWSFGGKTGKIIPVISSMTPVFNREPILAERLPTNKRAYGGKPNSILKLYSEDVLDKMQAERITRRGYEDPQPSKTSPANKFRNYQLNHDDVEDRPSPKFILGRR